ncbi:MAG: di-heme oxidoredictase family protein [Rikenellaceae bacterium]
MSNKSNYLYFLATLIFAVGCANDDNQDNTSENNEFPDYYYTGGELGTSTIWESKCFEQPSEAVDAAGLANAFLHGEGIFEGNFVTEATDETYPMRGKGPLSIRSMCLYCHPGYGHGKRLGDYGNDVVGFNTTSRETGNGYLLVVYGAGADGAFGGDEVITSGITGSTWQNPNAEDDSYVSELTGMPQTQSISPFKEPIDENKIEIKWLKYTDEHGNQFADGTTYDLIYPEVIIPDDAFAYKNENLTNGNYKVKLEATIGIYGTGLLDAITEDDIDDEYASQLSEVYGGRRGADKAQPDGSVRKGRFTYGLTRGTLQYGAGSNAIWNITNVTKEGANREQHSNYMTDFYADAAANDPEILAALPDTYYAFLIGDTEEETKIKVYNYLRFNSTSGERRYTSYTDVDATTQFSPELPLEDYIDFMVWHRGLAVPAARNTGTTEFERGRELFSQMSCDKCHRPSWTTGPDNYVGDADLVDQLPTYPYQKIWPYTDMLQHNLGMKNNIRTGWCRTTPLWGRYLNLVANGESSHLHDMRARNYEEAIMWHKGQGKYSSDQFRELSAEDRAAVVKFLQSI